MYYHYEVNLLYEFKSEIKLFNELFMKKSV